MNKQKFLKLIRNPEAIAAKDLNDLKAVTETYPFCNIAYSLLAKGFHNINSDEFPAKLHMAAIYSANRQRLKQLIEENSQKFIEEISHKNPEPDHAEEVRHAPKEKEEESPEEKAETAPDENARTDQKGPVSNEKGKTITPPGETDTEKLHRELQKNLQQLHQHKNVAKSNADADLTRINKRIKEQTQLIDEFIEKAPTLAKPDLDKYKEQQKQEDLSLKSLKIKDDMASENLAMIMARQGKTDQAINIYHKLILKFPEKKVYFASRIEELKKR